MMAEDFDDYMDEDLDDFDDDFDEDDFDEEFTEEDLAEIKRAEQDINMGFTYTHMFVDGKSCLKCDKCGRTAKFGERPFPHRFDCPMRH
jgi:predicted metal-binding protein